MNNANSETENDSVYHEEWLSAYLDDELTEEQRQIVEARLATDSSARALLEDLKKVHNLIGDLPAWKGPGIDTASVVTGADLDEQLDLADELEREDIDEPLEEEEFDDDEWDSELEAEQHDSFGGPQLNSFDDNIPRHMPGWVRPAVMAASVLAMLGIGYFLWDGTALQMLASSKTTGDNTAPAGAASRAGQAADENADDPSAGLSNDVENAPDSANMLQHMAADEAEEESLFAQQMKSRTSEAMQDGMANNAGIAASPQAMSMAPEQFKLEVPAANPSVAADSIPDSDSLRLNGASEPSSTLPKASRGARSGVGGRSQRRQSPMQANSADGGLAADGLSSGGGGMGGGASGSAPAVAGMSNAAPEESASPEMALNSSTGDLPPPRIKMNVPPDGGIASNDTEAPSAGQRGRDNGPRIEQALEPSMAMDAAPPTAGQDSEQGVAEAGEQPSSAASRARENSAPADASQEEPEDSGEEGTRSSPPSAEQLVNRTLISVSIGTAWQESRVGPALAAAIGLLGRKLDGIRDTGNSGVGVDLAVTSMPITELDTATRDAKAVVPSLKPSSSQTWRFKQAAESGGNPAPGVAKAGLVAFFVSRKEAQQILSGAFSGDKSGATAWIRISTASNSGADPVILLISPEG